MEYPEFFLRFMGACRRKHLRGEATMRELVHEFLKPSSRPPINPLKGGRYRIPDTSELGQGFIRMEPWEIDYLFALTAQAQRRILETGRRFGGSTLVLACANPRVPIHSIDIAPADDEKLREIFRKFDVGGNVDLIVGDSQRGAYPAIDGIDLLFIDADHSFDGCLADLEQWYPRVVPGGHVLLHDCYSGSDVQRAVIDFVDRNDVSMIQSPYVSASHWRNPVGSMTHFRRPARAGSSSARVA